MPTYTYSCDNCNAIFELFFHIKDYEENPKCTSCKKKQTHREYTKDLSTLHSSVKKSDTELKTLGDLAKRNRDRFTDEQKQEMYNRHNSYKQEEPQKELPKGMSRIKKPKTKIKWR